MANPKFMTLQDLKKREEEQALQEFKNSNISTIDSIDENVIEALSKSSSPKSGASTSGRSTPSSSSNIHTLADYKDEETERTKEEIQNILQKKTFGVWDVIKMLIPISFTMLLVIVYMKFIEQNEFCEGLPLIAIDVTSLPSFGNLFDALIMISMIVMITFCLVLLFYYRCDNTIKGLLALIIGIIVVLTSFVVLRNILILFNIPFDLITECLLIWNYTVSAIISIFWKAPLIVNQAFLVNVSALVAIGFLKNMNQTTTWALLVLMIFWDLFAVLCSYGPLNLLVKHIAKRRQEDPNYKPPPGLFYSFTLIWFGFESIPKTKKEELENKGINIEELSDAIVITVFDKPMLGLGDFIFYSVLMGRAALNEDLNLIVGCYLGIIVGFFLTFILLLIYKKPLPALPISLTFGIIIFVITYFCVNPFLNEMSSHLIYF